MKIPLLVAASLAAIIIGCTSSEPAPTPSVRVSPVAGVVDCGVSDLRPPNPYDAVGVKCVWDAYAARTPTRWTVTAYTTEGAAVPETIKVDGGAVVVTRDMSADALSSGPDRRLWVWRCNTMKQRPWVTDPQRFSLELSDCSGDSAIAVFP